MGRPVPVALPEQRWPPPGRASRAEGAGRLLKQTKISSHSPVDCRHTFASLLLQAGAPLLYVSKQMGHASSATTLRFYADYIPEQGQRWVNAADRQVENLSSAGRKTLTGTKTAQVCGRSADEV